MAKTDSLILLFAAAACAGSPVRWDLLENPELYQSTGFRAVRVQQRTVYVAPLEDRRRPPDPYVEGIYPATYTLDRYWARPVRPMLNEVILNEIEEAGLFASLVDEESLADWTIQPILLQFHGSVEERVIGRRTRGLTAILLKVFGARGPDGSRQKLREVRIEAAVESRSRFGGPNPYLLASASFRKAMGMMLADLEHGGRVFDQEDQDLSEPAKEQPWRRDAGLTEAGKGPEGFR
ncbi:MAG: hypothetical protein ACE5F1_11765 [Planctomycetota bacterium]